MQHDICTIANKPISNELNTIFLYLNDFKRHLWIELIIYFDSQAMMFVASEMDPISRMTSFTLLIEY